jgi:hypothetical protein
VNSVQIDPEKVIARMAQQLGELHAQIAMRDVALDAAHARIAELETDAETPAEPAPQEH